MSSPIDALITRARAAADDTTASSTSPADDRQKLQRLASEFESMLLNQMLVEMRKAGRWDDDGEDSKDGFGVSALLETLDAEFSKQMSKAQGLGLSDQLLTALDRLQHPGAAGAEDTPVATTGVPTMEAMAVGGLDPVAAGRSLLDGEGAISGAGSSAVTSGFGWRRDPITGEARFHKGVDLRAVYGQDVATAAGGTVAFSGTQGSYGTTVVIEHPNGTRSRYAHLSLALVKAGDAVEAGQLVGRAGSSGRATGPHVHLEVLDRDGRPLNPLAQPDLDH